MIFFIYFHPLYVLNIPILNFKSSQLTFLLNMGNIPIEIKDLTDKFQIHQKSIMIRDSVICVYIN